MNKAGFVDFVGLLKERTPNFVDRMESPVFRGMYNFSLSGDLASKKKIWGLGQTTFAARTFYIFDCLTDQKKETLCAFIERFSHPDGSYYDDYVERKTLVRRFLSGIRHLDKDNLTNKLNIRAESRQANAAMINLGKSPKDYLVLNLQSIDVDQYFKKFDWGKPWASGSHINHLIFFTKYSGIINDSRKNYIYKKVEENIESLINSDGFYSPGVDISPREKIGGGMKLLMGLSLVGKEKEWIRTGHIDFALDQMVSNNACENFNTLYVLYHATKHTTYRREEIVAFALNEVSKWQGYFYPKIGGFSFHPNKASSYYYGAKLSRGLDEPDMHGTAMFVWGVLVVAEILGIDIELGLKKPIL